MIQLDAARAQLYLDAAQVIMVALDMRGRVTLVNQYASTVLGWTSDELVGRNFIDTCIPARRRDGVRQRLSNVHAGDESTTENLIVTKSGDERLIEWRSTLLRDHDGRVVSTLSSGTDITARQLAEDEIRRLNAELEHRVVERTAELEAADKELESFSYSVSHDLRAPLRAVNGFATIVLEDYGSQLPEEGRRYLERIHNGGKRMGELIDDLLAFSRLGRGSMNRRTVDIDQLVRDALDELSPQHEGRPVEFAIGNLPCCHGDPALLKQAWVNLLSNAIKYSRGRTPAVIEIGCRREQDEDVYFVRDNGAGFDMAYAGKLFGVFQRLHRADQFEGSGVGLAIVQRIVQRHGGRVWADAEEDRGAAFHFTLGRSCQR